MFNLFRPNNKNEIRVRDRVKKKSATKRVVNDDLKETKEIIQKLKEIQKSVTALKRGGKSNPKLNDLLDSISRESYKICLKC